MNVLRKLTLSYRLFLLIGILAAGLVLYGSWSFRTLDRVKVNGPLYGEIMASKDVIADALPPPLYIIASYLVSLQMAAAGADPARLPELQMRLGQLREQHAARQRHWAAQKLDAALARQLSAADAASTRFYAVAFARLIPALHRGERPQADAALATMAGEYEAHRQAVDALVARAAALAATAEAAGAAEIRLERRRLLLILLAALAIGLAAALVIARSISTPLREALGLAQRVAAGDMSARGHARFADEPGQLLDALDAMSASLARMLAERDGAERSLRSAKELTERLIDSAGVVIIGLDRGGRVRLFNRTASQLTGYPAHDVLGQEWRALPLLGDGADRPMAEERPIISAAGEARRIAWQTTELDDEGGEIALLGFGIDVTERHAALEATRKAQDAAEAATRSKSDFLATMSHEIRTPMNAVIGMTRLALGTELDARQRNYLEKAERAAHGLLGIINDILDFSKIEAGKLRFEQRPMALRQALDHLAGMTVFKAQEKGLELLFDVAPDVPLEMTGDPLRLGQVLLNLVNNAIKFTERGEIVVAVRCLPGGDNEVRLQFEVRDTGIGITPEHAARLFEAFSQADASTTRTHGGTGLGLAISHKLVGMMDGRLWLERGDGGSCFRFTARFGRLAGASLLPACGAEVAAMKVLVVDDNDAAREILLGILESLQMRAASAASARDAIAELEAAERAGDPYRMVLMDWIMPQVDGLEAIRAIRANPAISDTLQIIMVTAYSRDDLLAKAGDLDRMGVLDKPVTPSSALDAIVGILHQRRDSLPARPQRRLAAAVHALHNASVLLVEDNEVNQELAVDVLEKLGLSVSVAGNGQRALDMLEHHHFDLILMDCQMPVMDGFEATSRIRAQARFAHLPVLAMTANAMSGDRERCLAAGMNDHISKPIDPDLLALTLARWLGPGAPAGGDSAESFPALRRAGMEVDAALERLHGNQVAYRKLLAQLQALAGEFAGKVQTALESGGTELARRLAHHLQGLASNCGATALSDAGRWLEHCIETGTGEAQQLALTQAELVRVAAALAAETAAKS
jgi:PAS domain S-box-containing protein